MCPDATRSQDTTCAFPGCSKTVWEDPDGSFSLFCSRTHLEGYSKISTLPKCKNCQVKPTYVEDHDFCGIRCATAYRNGQRHPQRPTSSQPAGCSLPGCRRHVYVDREGNPSMYCSQNHRLKAVTDGIAEPCLWCKAWPKNIINEKPRDFCSKVCADVAMYNVPCVLPVPSNQRAYQEVSRQFTDQWKHPSAIPNIYKIWKIYCSKEHNDRFSRYKLAVERRTGLQSGNTRRRWHGTIRGCTLGDKQDNDQFCGDPMCSLCNILQSSFELAKAGQRTNFGRFGAGIYTSATSSKANDYIWERGGSSYRAVLLNEVVMGNVIKMTQDNPNLTEPPAGFDAVVGEPGGVLNYDESIVYKNEAIRPLYLIIFEP